MANITYIQPDGAQQTVVGEPGMTVMETAKKHLIDGIEAECGGACACATCHVYVEPVWLDRTGLPEAGSQEASMLSFAAGAQPDSRLLCQIRMRTDLDGLTVKMPEVRINPPEREYAK